jgi:membrane associated rhomboid family serine protease
MIPLRDDQPRTLIPFVNWALIAANIGVFIFEVKSGAGIMPTTLEDYKAQLAFFDHYGVVPSHFQMAFSGTGPYTIAGVFGTILTGMFMHGGPLHLIGNMWFLWIFGNKVEDHFGHVLYPFYYLVCGVLAAMTHIYARPESTIPAIGASGAIAGVMGGYLLRYTTAKVQMFGWFFYKAYLFWISAAWMLIYWFGLQIVSQISTQWISAQIHHEVGGVAYWAHIGGFLSGMVLIKLIPGRTSYAHGGWVDKEGKEMLPKESTKI